MPNHIHGIIIIEKTVSGVTVPLHPATQPQTGGFAGSKNPVLNENLSRIVRWYKGRSSFEIRKVNPVFQWQSRFHDHIIRNDATYRRINDYIETNPANWNKDRFSQQPTLP
jgi:REP element-mobilizing transposase RayT